MGATMKFLLSRPGLMESLVQYKAFDLYDSWVDANATESGDDLPSFIEEELLLNYDRQFGTDYLKQAVSFYEREDA